ncbi:MAG: chorismate synthase [Chlorobi bacterium]|nr:chorismate synthase [Chlorobiota bacterium]
MSNVFGRILRLTSFGESHGPAVGGILEGMPAGVEVDFERIGRQLARRRPGQSKLTTSRPESDEPEFLSGIFEGRTLGTPIAFVVRNRHARSADYEHLRDAYRPSHADYTYEQKYGLRDWRGGGRASARETVARIIGGELAGMLIPDVEVTAYVHAVGTEELNRSWEELDLGRIDDHAVRTPDPAAAERFAALIEQARREGDTLGGQIVCVVKNVPPGWGEPVFDKLQARLAAAMLSIPAVKGFEYGSGFGGSRMHGSEHNDIFLPEGGTATNRSGGIQGGITNGMPVYFRVAFKPVATLMRPQPTINREGKRVEIEGKGRHDPCVVPRAVPIVESMTRLVLADFYLLQKIQAHGQT